ncbi:MAG: micrococcal nuclease [bacterium]|jgi:micrococcal nuclease
MEESKLKSIAILLYVFPFLFFTFPNNTKGNPFSAKFDKPKRYKKHYGSFKNVTFVRCYDGDTCTFNIKDIHPLFGRKINVRLAGIDTPERRGKCSREKRLAKNAAKRVRKILRNARRINLEQMRRGKYFRIVAMIRADGVNINELLVKEGHAIRYFGKRKKKLHWCK